MEAGKNEGTIYLNANENPYALPGLEGLNRYPEPQLLALREAFACNYGIENDQLVITRGADEAISLLVRTFCEPHQDQILINPPTFGIYSVYTGTLPCKTLSVPLIRKGDEFILDHETIIAKARNPENNVKLVFLCSPNNPTGNSFSHDIIAEICDELEGHAVVVLDEAYAEFSKNGNMVEDLESTPNLIILRTLSKAYSFAGMRMGCLLCADTDFIELVKTKVMETYPLPRLSIEAAFHVLSPEISALAKENIAKILEERTRMEDALGKAEQVTRVYPSDANFLLVEMKDANGFCDFAEHNNVIIRNFSSKEGTENCLRLSIGTSEENNLVLELLEKFES
ncbi:MAG: histidinol-phosphate transaminase [Alphaproteobacteria bacterium]|nr:histidinol-phosphate transaminase [Alphaproteobacteria bacterium]